MTLDKLLAEFYKRNGIDKHGGINDDTFDVKVLGINFKPHFAIKRNWVTYLIFY